MENKRERLVFVGEVVDSSKGQFKIQLEDSSATVIATLSGKIRQNSVKILVGDRVDVEVSEFDMSRGRIVYRHKS
jgi:translation initiation factor IF-1